MSPVIVLNLSVFYPFWMVAYFQVADNCLLCSFPVYHVLKWKLYGIKKSTIVLKFDSKIIKNKYCIKTDDFIRF